MSGRTRWILTALCAALGAALLMPGAFAAPGDSDAQAIPPSCPSRTSESSYLGGDDFDPSTERSMGWTMDPAEGGWRFEAGEGEWRMHADPVPGNARATSDWVTLPDVQHLQLTLRHTRGAWPASDLVGRLRVLGVNGELTNRAFYGSGESGTTAVYLTQWRGQRVRVQLELKVTSDLPPGSATGWDIDDISLHTCFDPLPGHLSIDETKARDGAEAFVSWLPPSWKGTGLTGYTVTVTRNRESEPVQVHSLPSNSHSVVVRDLVGGSYDVEVAATSASGSGPPSGGAFMETVSSVQASAAERVITYGQSTKVTALVTTPQGSQFSDGRLYVDMINKAGGQVIRQNWVENPGGPVALVLRPQFNSNYRATYEPHDSWKHYLTSVSASTESVSVRPAVSAAFNATSVAPGKTVHLRGRVAPAHPGTAVKLQRYVDGAWRTAQTKALSSTSGYDFSIKNWTKRKYTYRVVIAAHTDHATGYSPQRSYYVR